MIDSDRFRGNFSPNDKSITTSPLPEIDHLNEGQLLLLMDKIQAKLPSSKIADMNLDEELVRQFQRARDLQSRVLDDREVPPNQLAQVMNSVASVIESLIKLQERLYNAERFKAIEALIIEAIKSMPVEQAEKFLDEYEKMGELL